MPSILPRLSFSCVLCLLLWFCTCTGVCTHDNKLIHNIKMMHTAQINWFWTCFVLPICCRFFYFFLYCLLMETWVAEHNLRKCCFRTCNRFLKQQHNWLIFSNYLWGDYIYSSNYFFCFFMAVPYWLLTLL